MAILTTAPYLVTRRPSLTTVEYIVSTFPPLTIPLRILILATHLLRIAIGCGLLLLCYSRFAASSFASPLPKYASAPEIFTNEYIWYTAERILDSWLGKVFTQVSLQIPVAVLIPSSLAIFYALLLRPHTTESLLIIRGLGIQTSSSSQTYLSTATTRFIPTEKIQDVYVNEAFRGFEVRYYLVVVVEEEDEVVVVFPRLLPRRTIIERVWRGARGVLWEPEAKKAKI